MLIAPTMICFVTLYFCSAAITDFCFKYFTILHYSRFDFTRTT